jgi:hypothetical protein
MPRGGYRNGSGRARIHLDEHGNNTCIRAQILLTPEVEALLTKMMNEQRVGRSEFIRRLILNAAQSLNLRR